MMAWGTSLPLGLRDGFIRDIPIFSIIFTDCVFSSLALAMTLLKDHLSSPRVRTARAASVARPLPQ